MVRPLAKWLDEKGVRFVTDTIVSDIQFERIKEAQRPAALVIERAGSTEEIKLDNNDYVIVTLGSMADSATLGSMNAPAPYEPEKKGAGWRLWEKIPRAGPSSAIRRRSTAARINRNGCPLQARCAIRPSSGS